MTDTIFLSKLPAQIWTNILSARYHVLGGHSHVLLWSCNLFDLCVVHVYRLLSFKIPVLIRFRYPLLFDSIGDAFANGSFYGHIHRLQNLRKVKFTQFCIFCVLVLSLVCSLIVSASKH